METKRGNDDSGCKMSRCIKGSMRVLCRARDFYVKSMSNYAGRMHYGATTSLPKSFRVNSPRASEDEDLRELMRAVSQRRMEEEGESTRSKRLPNSFTMEIGRIDEEKPCYFQEGLKSDVLMCPRSRSYAVNKRTGMLA